MGVKISIDKHMSELDDILEMSPHYLNKVTFESKISPDITQHLKVHYHIFFKYLLYAILIFRSVNQFIFCISYLMIYLFCLCIII